jgi:hypothetical protein
MNDEPASDPQLPLFLAEDFDDIKQQAPSRIFKLGVLAMAAAVIAGAIVIWGEPVARLAAVTGTLVGASAQAPDTDQATPPAPSSDQAQATPPAGGDGTKAQAAAAPVAADPPQAEGSAALFKQFQAWAQQQDGRPDSQPQESTPQPSPSQALQSPPQVTQQDAAAEPVAPAQPVDKLQAAPPSAAPAPVRAAAAPKPRQPVRELRNARAEMEAARRAQAKVAHATPTRSPPADDGRGQDAPAQTTQSPSLLQIFGLHN